VREREREREILWVRSLEEKVRIPQLTYTHTRLTRTHPPQTSALKSRMTCVCVQCVCVFERQGFFGTLSQMCCGATTGGDQLIAVRSVLFDLLRHSSAKTAKQNLPSKNCNKTAAIL
jgi:hypothetical protein